MEKRWGVFFQPGRSMVRGTGQRPWGEPGTQIGLKYSGISKTPVSSSPSTCRHWPLSFALVFVPRRNFHWRGFRTPGCLSVLVFKWFWETLFVHWQGVVIGFPNRFEIQTKNIFQPHWRRWFRYWKSSSPLCNFSRFEGWTSGPRNNYCKHIFCIYEQI